MCVSQSWKLVGIVVVSHIGRGRTPIKTRRSSRVGNGKRVGCRGTREARYGRGGGFHGDAAALGDSHQACRGVDGCAGGVCCNLIGNSSRVARCRGGSLRISLCRRIGNRRRGVCKSCLRRRVCICYIIDPDIINNTTSALNSRKCN